MSDEKKLNELVTSISEFITLAEKLSSLKNLYCPAPKLAIIGVVEKLSYLSGFSEDFINEILDDVPHSLWEHWYKNSTARGFETSVIDVASMTYLKEAAR